MSKQVILEANGIQKSFGSQSVLDVSNFKVYAGVSNFLLGTNGSGKTTLFKILSLVDQDYSGELLYRGERMENQEKARLELRRHFSVIWQNPYLYKGSVAYNIGLPLELRNVDQKTIRAEVGQLAEKLQIEHLLLKRSGTLSGGEKQKVSIARALITQPEILFIDEPTTNLDYESNQYFNELFLQLVLSGMTIVLITHDLYQIRYLADYITILKDGKVVSSGAKEEYNLNGAPLRKWQD